MNNKSNPKVFFDHLTLYSETISFLDGFAMDPEEKEEIIQIIDEIYHHHTLNLILSHLPKTHHEKFIHQLKADPNDPGLLVFIKENIEVNIDIESEIKSQSQKIHHDLIKEIQKSKKLTSKYKA